MEFEVSNTDENYSISNGADNSIPKRFPNGDNSFEKDGNFSDSESISSKNDFRRYGYISPDPALNKDILNAHSYSDLSLRVSKKPPLARVITYKNKPINGVTKNHTLVKNDSMDIIKNELNHKQKENQSQYNKTIEKENCSSTESFESKSNQMKKFFQDDETIKDVHLSPRRSTPIVIKSIPDTSTLGKENINRMSKVEEELKKTEVDQNIRIKEFRELQLDLERIKKRLLVLEKNELNNVKNDKGEKREDREKQEIKPILKTASTESCSKIPQDKIPDLTPQQKANRNRVLINIGGIRHETYRSTLKNIPDTRLSWIAEESAFQSPEYDPITREFFFDRHPQVFAHILNYYRTGNLHVPYDVCGPLYEDELQYWGIDDSQVESCCWLSYRQHRDAQETLKEFEGIEFEKDFDDDSEPDLTKYGFAVDENEENETLTWYQKWQPVIWKFMEDPYSSAKAKVMAYTSMILIMLSVIIFCLETMKEFDQDSTKLAFNIMEGCCVLFFSIELILRFVFCPNKKLFLKGIMNWIDFLAIIPFFVTCALTQGFRHDHNNEFNFLQSIRVIRVFRIIKLSKHSVGLQILGHTLKASFRELLLLIFFLIIGIVIFSSLVFYCEKNEKDTSFTSIPTTFWWAVITMTTVGYGDMVPATVFGRIIGALCSVSGVLMIALPVPVIVNNFNLYYSHAQARLKLPKKKRRMLCGAANALKGPAMEEFERQNTDNTTLDELPRIHTKRPSLASITTNNTNNSLASMRSPKGNEHTGKENEHLNTSSENLVALRMKKFGRRDSNMFSTQNTSPTTLPKNGELSPNSNTRSNSVNYASHKRRSLLPAMSSLPEIEQ